MRNHIIVAGAACLAATSPVSANEVRYKTIDARGGMTTDFYYSRDTARSMLKTIVENRLAKKCREIYGGSIQYDTVKYVERFSGQDGGRTNRAQHRYFAPQASAVCRYRN